MDDAHTRYARTMLVVLVIYVMALWLIGTSLLRADFDATNHSPIGERDAIAKALCARVADDWDSPSDRAFYHEQADTILAAIRSYYSGHPERVSDEMVRVLEEELHREPTGRFGTRPGWNYFAKRGVAGTLSKIG